MPDPHRERKTRRRRHWVLAVAGPTAVVALWVLLTEGGLVAPLFLPGPRQVVVAVHDIGPELPKHILATLGRTVLGFSLGVTLGISIGLFMGHFACVRASLFGVVESWRPVPPVALIPFFLLWFGFSLFGKVLLVAFGVGLVMVVGTYEAVRNVPIYYVEAAQTLGVGRWGILWSVIWPAIRPELRGPMRVSLAMSVSLVIVSEFMGAQEGLGYLINVSKVTFSTHVILLTIIVLGLLSAVLDFALRRILEVTTRWF